MKKIIILTLVCAFVQNCFAQERIISKINFFDTIDTLNINLYNCKLENKLTISYFSKGLGLYESKNGCGAFFAIPKKEFGVWKVENKSGLKREEVWKNSQEKIKNAKEFLTYSRDSLFLYFDLYTFYVRQNDLIIEGSYMSDDGQLRDNYSVKDYATVYVYKYNGINWVEIKKDNLGTDTPGYYGDDYVATILQKRFGQIVLE